MRIDILLATYNGARYLPMQLDSLLAQSHQNWRVIARDDGSTDTSVEVLGRYALAYPDRFTLLKDGQKLGAKHSFAELMRHAEAPYVAFCDQDDFWLPQKLTVLLALIQTAERDLGEGVPVLAHSDLELVNQEMESIAPSFWGYQGINPSRNHLCHLLVENTVTGCATLMNRALLQKALPLPEAAYMHDYWLGLLAATIGRIVFTREALVRYRQHSSNTLGAVKIRGLFSLPGGTLNPVKWKISYQVACDQARALVSALSGVSDPLKLAPAMRFAGLYQHGWLGRRWVLLMNASLPSRWRRRISVLARI
ncbi:MAG TPA: glycosyltransferase family 2 protein [Rhodocyclaceae bacterium]|nr:glycosyltransferase family 2 protein [Rhodocyclaceae bacterium]